MTRLTMLSITLLLTALAAWADPPGAFRVPPVAPPPVDLPIVVTHPYVDPPGIIVAQIDPRVVDKCVRGMLKMSVPLSSPVQVLPLEIKGLDLRAPFGVAPEPPPFPSAPPTLRLHNFQKR